MLGRQSWREPGSFLDTMGNWVKKDKAPVFPWGEHKDYSFGPGGSADKVVDDSFLWYVVREFQRPEWKLNAAQALAIRGRLSLIQSEAQGPTGSEVTFKVTKGKLTKEVNLPFEWLEGIKLAGTHKAFFEYVLAEGALKGPSGVDLSVLGDIVFTNWAREALEEELASEVAVLKAVGTDAPHEVLFREALERGDLSGSTVKYLGLVWSFDQQNSVVNGIAHRTTRVSGINR